MEKAAAQGKDVPALRMRPEVPLWLVPALDAWADLGGASSWWRVREWADYYGIELEWLWPVLRQAAHMLDEHAAKVKKANRASATRSQKRSRS